MKLILDTHILLWTLTGNQKLPEEARRLISDGENVIYYSIASVWEVEIKHSIGKIAISGKQLSDYCKRAGFKPLEIKEEHIFRLSTLKREENTPRHNDPFDRIMLSQTKTEGFKLLTHDVLISQYNESCVVLV
jgi:PIN domain nuclease of toxin-antitoxin system